MEGLLEMWELKASSSHTFKTHHSTQSETAVPGTTLSQQQKV